MLNFFVIAFAFFLVYAITAEAESVSVKVINYAGEPIELYWINTFQKNIEYVRQTKKPIRNSTEAVINSYDTHQFQVRFLRDDPEASVVFTKGPEDETVIVRFNDETGKLELEQVTDLNKLFKQVEEDISEKCYQLHSLGSQELADCVSDIIMHEVHRLERTMNVMKHYHGIMSSKLREYSCENHDFTPSSAQRSFNFNFLGNAYNASVYLDTNRAKIFTVDDFLTANECSILRQQSRPIPNMSSHSTFTVAYTISSKTDPLWEAFSRAIYFTNFAAGYQIQKDNQEHILLSKFGVGEEIKPRCDGSCNGGKFSEGDFVASVFVDCTAPIEGGEYIMADANVFLRPEVGQAIVIAYKGEDNKMDDGFTRYSTCPVMQGERYLVRMQFREGEIAQSSSPSPRGLSSPATTTSSVEASKNTESFDHFDESDDEF